MKLYVFRHGTTDWNEAKRLQGNSNTSLNEKGRELARITAEAVKDVRFDYVFSSPLDRAYETACILCKDRDVEIVKDDRLIEVCFGIDEGVVPEKRTPGCHFFFETPEKYVPAKGAESFEHLLERTKSFIYEVLVPLSIEEPDATVMISGHGAMNKALSTNLCHRDVAHFWDGAWQKNCSLTIYEITGESFKMLEDGKIFY